MTEFTGDLTVTQLSGKPGAWRLWKLEQTLVYQINPDQNELDAAGYTEGAGRPHVEAPTRTHADGIFRDAMRACGVGIFSRTLLYVGVRIGTVFKVKTTMVGFNEKLKASMEAVSS